MVVLISGATTKERVRENMKVENMKVVKLTKDELGGIEGILKTFEAKGTGYPEQEIALLNRLDFAVALKNDEAQEYPPSGKRHTNI